MYSKNVTRIQANIELDMDKQESFNSHFPHHLAAHKFLDTAPEKYTAAADFTF